MVSYTLDEIVVNFSNNQTTPNLKELTTGLPGQTNVAIAVPLGLERSSVSAGTKAAVTAYSRMIINGFKLAAMEQGLEIYYSDTDSLVVNSPLSPEHIDSALGFRRDEAPL
jgi:hypothetical protein